MGATKRPQRLLVYGPEGIGKSTLASQMPDPVFIDVEDGTSQLEVARIDAPKDWGMLLAEVAYLTGDHNGASSIVIDTADAAERLCQMRVCSKFGKGGIEDFGYGKGYVYARDEFNQLLEALDRAVASGLNVILVCHSTMRKFERPDEAGAYDRFELKLNKHVSALVKEWADAVLFVDWETFVSVDDNGKAKAKGGKRIIRTDHSPVWDAKNRWGLPETVTLDADGIALIRSHLTVADQPAQAAKPEPEPKPEPKAEPKADPETAPEPKTAEEAVDELKDQAARMKKLGRRFSKLKKLMVDDGVSIAELEDVMASKGKRDPGQPIESWETGFIEWTVKQWPSVKKLVAELRDIRKVAAATDCPF